MKVELNDVLHLLRLYRHDLMNQLQLVDGYASMKQHDLSQEKLHNLIKSLRDERLLQTLDAPQYVYWLIQLKLKEREMEIEFDIEHNEDSLLEFDDRLVHDGKRLFGEIKDHVDEFSQLHILIQIKHEHDWYIKYQVKGIDLSDGDFQADWKGRLEKVKKDNTTSFVFTYK
ncbi:Spo0B domain-containing protein [Piscibacillus sp. B03]|uniref:Spo0B domain-containing protein n=1 Tax=Piscibacillus sp. B03 TaxID=3457430 RepID=UPI003FCC9E57